MIINKTWLIIGMVLLIGTVIGGGISLSTFGGIDIFDDKSDALIERNNTYSSYEDTKEGYVNTSYRNIEISKTVCEFDEQLKHEVCFKLFTYEWNGETYTTDAPLEDTEVYIKQFFRDLYEREHIPEPIYYDKPSIWGFG